MTERCTDCRFLHLVTSHRGICRRYPAEVQKNGVDWCGEFQPRVQVGLPGRPSRPDPLATALGERTTAGRARLRTQT